jgi:2-oxo-4-hydroxy-4-carboxy-5-ureidoimidazoline decarboxylase
MKLMHFNAAPAAQAASTLRPCADIDRWVKDIVEARPYATLADLLDQARTAAEPFTPEEIQAALAQHPRIGERARGASAEAALSRGEQAGIDAASQTTRDILAGNAAYEARFGRVFLIRAAGRSPEEILHELERRLGNTDEQEAHEVAGQLREIAVLRLQGLLEES